MPYSNASVAKATTVAPVGYVVAAGYADLAAQKLQAHGVTFTRLTHARAVDVEVLRASAVVFGAKPYEARQSAVDFSPVGFTVEDIAGRSSGGSDRG